MSGIIPTLTVRKITLLEFESIFLNLYMIFTIVNIDLWFIDLNCEIICLDFCYYVPNKYKLGNCFWPCSIPVNPLISNWLFLGSHVNNILLFYHNIQNNSGKQSETKNHKPVVYKLWTFIQCSKYWYEILRKQKMKTL